MKFCNCFMLAALALIYTSAAMAQPDTLWTRTYGGIDGDVGYSGQQTADGGFIVAGRTSSFGAGYGDVWLVKVDVQGDTLWTQTYGGVNGEYGYSVQQTSDGGYIIGGHTMSYGVFQADVYLVKTDILGNQQWQQTYGDSGGDWCKSVQQTTDGGYISLGYTSSYGPGGNAIYLVKTDASGDSLWTRTYGGSGYDTGQSGQQTADGGYIIAGYTDSYGAGSKDVYLIKTDASGDTLWTRTYGGTGSDYGYDVHQTLDGGYIIAGKTSSYGAGSSDVWLIKTDALGDTLWTQTYGGSALDYGYDVHQTTDGGYIITGRTASFGAGGYDVYLVKTDASGDTVWTQTFGGSSNEYGYGVQQTSDGGYIIAGYTSSYGAGSSDFYLIRLGTPEVTVTLTPHEPPIQIPAGGGSFQFDLAIENTTTEAIVADAWIDITPPGGPVAPLIVRLDVTFPANTTISRDTLTQNVPARAPAGTYVYTCSVGEMMGAIINYDQFTFEKLETGEGIVNDWNLSGWEDEAVPASAPAEFTLSSAYPNPFNPLTTISYQLSAISFVNLSVYDASGRLVAELVDGWREAGIHEVTFDASRLASGVYIYRIETDNFSAVKKMVLMK